MMSGTVKTATAAALLAAPLMLGGCVIAVSEDGFDSDFDHHADFDRSAGSVFGADVTADAVTFRVTSNGCTDQSYFDVDVDRRGEGRYDVTIERREADKCRALLQDGVELTWTFDELRIPEGADVRIGNQVRRR